MKKFFFVEFFAICAIFSSCDKFSLENIASEKKPLIPLEIWYEPYSSAAYPLPSDWFGFKQIENELGIKLKAVPIPAKKEEQAEVLRKAARANALPDLFIVEYDVLAEFVREGKVARLDSMYSMMPERTRRMYNKSTMEYAIFNGSSYGLSHSGNIDRNEGILIRKDWLDRLNLEIPKTTDDFLKTMKAFTFGDPDGNGRNDTYGFGAFLEFNNYEEYFGRRFAPIFGAFGVEGTFDAKRENLILNIYKEEFFDALQFVQTMVSEQIIDPNWLVYKKDEFREAWKHGRFGIMREQNAAFAMESAYSEFDSLFPDGEWILIEPPVGPDGKKSVGCYTKSYRTFAVSHRTEELGKIPALAKLLEWFSTKGYNSVSYGKQGENFTLDEKGKVSAANLPDPELAYTKPEAAPLLQLRNLVFYGSDEEFAARYPTWKTIRGREMSALKLLREMQKMPWTRAAAVPPAPNALRSFMEQGIVDFASGKRKLTKSNWKDWLSEFDRVGGIAWEKQCRDFVEKNALFTD